MDEGGGDEAEKEIPSPGTAAIVGIPGMYNTIAVLIPVDTMLLEDLGVSAWNIRSLEKVG